MFNGALRRALLRQGYRKPIPRTRRRERVARGSMSHALQEPPHVGRLVPINKTYAPRSDM
jgi:hypothetical protein